jgi:hypothetical protein
MSEHSYYGQEFEGKLITALSVVIILSMFGAWKLMSSRINDCKAMDYTYCGENDTAYPKTGHETAGE